MPDNVALDYHYGDAEKVAAAFAGAAHVTKLSLRNTRLVVAAMEPRAAVAEYDPASERFTLHAQSQGVFGMKNQLADILGVKPDKVHMLTGNVGGSFGMKAPVYSEYVCMLHAAKLLGRPVKWTDDRSGSLRLGFAWPRPRGDRRTCARQGRKFSRGPRRRASPIWAHFSRRSRRCPARSIS